MPEDLVFLSYRGFLNENSPHRLKDLNFLYTVGRIWGEAVTDVALLEQVVVA